MKPIRISSDVTVGQGHPLVVLAGPCVVEERDFTLQVAEIIKTICAKRATPLIFKASFDKANRTSSTSARGPGIDEGLAVLQLVRDALGVPIVTDIHESCQAKKAARVADVLQIPAFLSRQTDLLQAAAETGRAVNVKKGQFLSPSEMRGAVAKLETAGCDRILLTERGTTFGYNNLVVDFRALPQLRALGYPVVFDATHSVQLPGGLGHASGGQREYVPFLARAAAAVGIDALFVEVHPDPDSAPSDGQTMLTPEAFDSLLDDVLAVRDASLEELSLDPARFRTDA